MHIHVYVHIYIYVYTSRAASWMMLFVISIHIYLRDTILYIRVTSVKGGYSGDSIGTPIAASSTMRFIISNGMQIQRHGLFGGFRSSCLKIALCVAV